MVSISRLAEHDTVKDDFGIRTQDHRVRHRDHLQQAGTGLFAGDAAHVVRSGLFTTLLFWNVEVKHAEIQPQPGQQFSASRRAGGEMQHA